MGVANKRQIKVGDGGYDYGSKDQALRSNSIKRVIDKENVSAKCRMCGEGDETVSHNVLEVASWCRLVQVGS